MSDSKKYVPYTDFKERQYLRCWKDEAVVSPGFCRRCERSAGESDGAHWCYYKTEEDKDFSRREELIFVDGICPDCGQPITDERGKDGHGRLICYLCPRGERVKAMV